MHGLGHWQSKFPVVAVKACSICKNWKMYAGNCVTDFFQMHIGISEMNCFQKGPLSMEL